LMMSLESPELFGVTRLSDLAISPMADNIVLLQFMRRDGGYGRGMTFIKSRAMAIEPRLWEYRIGPTGIALTSPDHERHHNR